MQHLHYSEPGNFLNNYHSNLANSWGILKCFCAFDPFHSSLGDQEKPTGHEMYTFTRMTPFNCIELKYPKKALYKLLIPKAILCIFQRYHTTKAFTNYSQTTLNVSETLGVVQHENRSSFEKQSSSKKLICPFNKIYRKTVLSEYLCFSSKRIPFATVAMLPSFHLPQNYHNIYLKYNQRNDQTLIPSTTLCCLPKKVLNFAHYNTI